MNELVGQYSFTHLYGFHQGVNVEQLAGSAEPRFSHSLLSLSLLTSPFKSNISGGAKIRRKTPPLLRKVLVTVRKDTRYPVCP